MTGNKILQLGFAVAGVAFFWSGIKHAFVGGSTNVAFLGIGVACLAVGWMIGRNRRVS